MQMYKVFFKEKVIYLTDKSEPASLNFHHVNSINDITESISFLDYDKKLTELYLYNNDLEKLKTMFESRFTIIEAAGGLIKNQNEDFLFIFRRGKWDLPKGKIDDGENPMQAAIREVEEETGLKNIEIIKELKQTYHTYTLYNKDILKKTYWFEMNFTGNETPVPQREEDISIAKWFKKEEFGKITQNTYLSILDVLELHK